MSLKWGGGGEAALPWVAEGGTPGRRREREGHGAREWPGALPRPRIHFPDLYSDPAFLLIVMRKENHHGHLASRGLRAREQRGGGAGKAQAPALFV